MFGWERGWGVLKPNSIQYSERIFVLSLCSEPSEWYRYRYRIVGTGTVANNAVCLWCSFSFMTSFVYFSSIFIASFVCRIIRRVHTVLYVPQRTYSYVTPWILLACDPFGALSTYICFFFLYPYVTLHYYYCTLPLFSSPFLYLLAKCQR